MYIPPQNFGFVEAHVYRSGQPNELNFPFLTHLSLRTVLWLAPEPPNPLFLEFLDDHGIEIHHLGVASSSHNAWDPITEEIVVAALELILREEMHPMMVMCNLGRHRTGTVVGCLRKLQGWNLTSVFEEYRRYAGVKVRIIEQFIELFDQGLPRMPSNPPKWVG